MSKFVMLILAAAILSACQTTPKFAPTTVEREGKLQGLAQAGIEEVKCDIYTPEFDETAEPFRQETYRRQFGRIFNDLELAALKKLSMAWPN